MSSQDHPSHHAHSSHQHGATHDPNVHSPHRHNHPSHTDPSHPIRPTASESNTTKFASPGGDASTDPHAPSSTKIMGDLKGAMHGVTGSLQAATGTLFGQKGMAERGFDKMSEEDARLAAKSGKPPVGTETRDKIVSEGEQAQVGGQHGVQGGRTA